MPDKRMDNAETLLTNQTCRTYTVAKSVEKFAFTRCDKLNGIFLHKDLRKAVRSKRSFN